MSALELEPTKTEFLSQTRHGSLIPVTCELPADLETPISAFLKLRNDREGFLLESVEGGETVGRYSFLGVGPFISLRADGDRVEIRDGEHLSVQTGDPLEIIRRAVGPGLPVGADELPRFYGGAVGYFGYDLTRPAAARLRHRDDLDLPDAYLIVAHAVVIFDHVKHTLKIAVNAIVRDEAAEAYRQAADRLEEVHQRLCAPLAVPEAAGRVDALHRSEMPVASFLEAVDRARGYARRGEVSRVMLSRRVGLDVPGADALDVYRALRTVSPAPYMFLLDFEGVALAGSSPELFIRVEEGLVESRPLSGTRPRGRDEEEDHAVAAGLLADEQERAEHQMLVDLARRELQAVTAPGSLAVAETASLERFSHVMHLVSDVRGRLAPGTDALDVLRACFPSVTVTGVPKAQAMEVIDELEPVARGPYGGAVGYLGFSGNMDTCLTIRTIVMAGGRAYLQAGAGIAADSVPERAYLEVVNKIKPLLRALEMAGRRYRQAPEAGRPAATGSGGG